GSDHPCDTGLPPFVPECGDLWDDADLVIAIGSDLDGTSTQNWAQPQPRHMLAINIDADDAIKNYRLDLVLVGDARSVTQALAERVREDGGVATLASHLGRLREETCLRLREQEPRRTEFLRPVARLQADDRVVVG